MTVTRIMSSPNTPQQCISRRALLKDSATAAVGIGAAALPSMEALAEQPVPGTSSGPLRLGKVIDCHAHLTHRSRQTWEADDRKLIEAADKLGIDQLCCSILTPRRPASADGFRECNQWTADGIRRFRGRVLGYCYANAGYGREALEEIRRCVEERGFIGIKLYNEYTCTEPVVFPVVELARRYPEAMLICAHISGGGDWEWTIKALRHTPNVMLDTSGSVTDDGSVDMAVAVVGVDRVVFGCDSSMTAGISKIRGADLSAQDKAKILGRNMVRLLGRRKA